MAFETLGIRLVAEGGREVDSAINRVINSILRYEKQLDRLSLSQANKIQVEKKQNAEKEAELKKSLDRQLRIVQNNEASMQAIEDKSLRAIAAKRKEIANIPVADMRRPSQKLLADLDEAVSKRGKSALEKQLESQLSGIRGLLSKVYQEYRITGDKILSVMNNATSSTAKAQREIDNINASINRLGGVDARAQFGARGRLSSIDKEIEHTKKLLLELYRTDVAGSNTEKGITRSQKEIEKFISEMNKLATATGAAMRKNRREINDVAMAIIKDGTALAKGLISDPKEIQILPEDTIQKVQEKVNRIKSILVSIRPDVETAFAEPEDMDTFLQNLISQASVLESISDKTKIAEQNRAYSSGDEQTKIRIELQKRLEDAIARRALEEQKAAATAAGVATQVLELERRKAQILQENAARQKEYSDELAKLSEKENSTREEMNQLLSQEAKLKAELDAATSEADSSAKEERLIEIRKKRKQLEQQLVNLTTDRAEVERKANFTLEESRRRYQDIEAELKDVQEESKKLEEQEKATAGTSKKSNIDFLETIKKVKAGWEAVFSVLKIGVGIVLSIGSAFMQVGGFIFNAVKGVASFAASILRIPFNAIKGVFDGIFNSIRRIFEVAFGFLVGDAIRNIGNQIRNLGGFALQAASDFQQLEIRMEGLLARDMTRSGTSNSIVEAMADPKLMSSVKEVFNWMTQLAITTRYTSENIGNVFTLSLTAGFNKQEAMGLTQSILDYASGMALADDKLISLIENFRQMRAANKITGTEIRDLTRGAYLPVNDVFAKMAENLKLDEKRWKELNLTAKDFEDANIDDTLNKIRVLGGMGEIKPDEFIKAFQQVVGRDFPNAAVNMADTWETATSNVKDFVETIIGLKILKPALDIFSKNINGVLRDLSLFFTQTGVGDKLGNIFKNITKIGTKAFNGIGSSIANAMFGGKINLTQDTIVSFFDSLDKAFSSYAEGNTTTAFMWLENSLKGIGIPEENRVKILDFFKSIDTYVQGLISGDITLEQLFTDLSATLVKIVVGGIGGALTALGNWFSDNKGTIQNKIATFVGEIMTPLTSWASTNSSLLDGVFQTVSGLWGMITGSGGVDPRYKERNTGGQDFAAGLDKIDTAITNLVNNGLTAFKEKFPAFESFLKAFGAGGLVESTLKGLSDMEKSLEAIANYLLAIGNYSIGAVALAFPNVGGDIKSLFATADESLDQSKNLLEASKKFLETVSNINEARRLLASQTGTNAASSLGIFQFLTQPLAGGTEQPMTNDRNGGGKPLYSPVDPQLDSIKTSIDNKSTGILESLNTLKTNIVTSIQTLLDDTKPKFVLFTDEMGIALGTFSSAWDATKQKIEEVKQSILWIIQNASKTYTFRVNVLYTETGNNPNSGNKAKKPSSTAISNANTNNNWGQNANGGSVFSSHVGLVGERGPELFIPKVNGTIIPNYSTSNVLKALMGGVVKNNPGVIGTTSRVYNNSVTYNNYKSGFYGPMNFSLGSKDNLYDMLMSMGVNG